MVRQTDKDSPLGHELFMLEVLLGSQKIETEEEFETRLVAYAQNRVDQVQENATLRKQLAEAQDTLDKYEAFYSAGYGIKKYKELEVKLAEAQDEAEKQKGLYGVAKMTRDELIRSEYAWMAERSKLRAELKDALGDEEDDNERLEQQLEDSVNEQGQLQHVIDLQAKEVAFLGKQLAEARELEKVLKDFALYGTRHDLNPTMVWKDDFDLGMQLTNYIKGMDAYVREKAVTALQSK